MNRLRKLLRPESLRWQLIQRIAVTQAVMVLVLSALSLAVVSAVMLSGSLVHSEYENNTIDALTEAVQRDAGGKLVVKDTGELARLRAEEPGFWYIVRDLQGNVVSAGQPPEAVRKLLPSLEMMREARLGADDNEQTRAIGLLRWVDTDVGRLRMLTGAHGQVTLWKILRESTPAYQMAIYLATLMTLSTITVTPLVVRRSLRGLDIAARKASDIDIDRSGTRLSSAAVPLEVQPFVHAVNEAFARLDRGYESRKRFLADAAHELRTPISILTIRLAALPPGPLRNRLLEDAARLSSLANQLLDLQRLDQGQTQFQPLDLVALAERVVVDIAPLVFNAGYDLRFEPAAVPVMVNGDEMAIDRALANLVQNAVSYGGRTGAITVTVAAAGWIEVADQGPGIPGAERERIFAPFHRLAQDGDGVGLGLDLVQQVMQLHGGVASVQPALRGACFRLTFPLG